LKADLSKNCVHLYLKPSNFSYLRKMYIDHLTFTVNFFLQVFNMYLIL